MMGHFEVAIVVSKVDVSCFINVVNRAMVVSSVMVRDTLPA